jgi:hypothetical protein
MRTMLRQLRGGLWTTIVVLTMLFSAIAASADGGSRDKSAYFGGGADTQSSGNTWEP